MKDCAAAGVQLAARKSSPATARAQNCPMVLPRGRGVAIRGGVVAVRILFAMYLRRRLCAPPRLPLGFWCFWFARRGFGARMLRVCLCYARSVCVCVCLRARARVCVRVSCLRVRRSSVSRCGHVGGVCSARSNSCGVVALKQFAAIKRFSLQHDGFVFFPLALAKANFDHPLRLPLPKNAVRGYHYIPARLIH